MPLSCGTDRQTGGCDYITCSHLICTSHCDSRRFIGVADRFEGIVCVCSFVAMSRASIVTHAVLTGMHRTVVPPRIMYLVYVYNCWSAALRRILFVSIYVIYFAFTSHVTAEIISDIYLQIFVLHTWTFISAFWAVNILLVPVLSLVFSCRALQMYEHELIVVRTLLHIAKSSFCFRLNRFYWYQYSPGQHHVSSVSLSD
jgi:hypothetical protein